MPKINPRTKGAGGEREICDMLNAIILEEADERGIVIETPPVQRNQNQTAVGGCDLVGTYNFAIEVKRQETLNVETWWKQCVESARKLGQIPILIFRQNRKSWRVVCFTKIEFNGFFSWTRGEVELESFLKIFRATAKHEFSKI